MKREDLILVKQTLDEYESKNACEGCAGDNNVKICCLFTPRECGFINQGKVWKLKNEGNGTESK